MTSQRHQSIGIKQTIRFEWIQKTVELAQSNRAPKAIGQELHDYLAEKPVSGRSGIRSENTRAFLVNNLRRIWVQPPKELVAFRDNALRHIGRQSCSALPIHWAMISAVYPFWHQVSNQIGRLLALQEEVTKAQISTRMMEKYGARETVARYTRYVVRSFVAWEILRDASTPGCYTKLMQYPIDDPRPAAILIEAGLHATASGKATIEQLLASPAYFPFRFDVNSRELLSQLSEQTEVVRTGSGDHLLVLSKQD